MPITYLWAFINDEAPQPSEPVKWRPGHPQSRTNNCERLMRALFEAPKGSGHLCLYIGGLSDGPRLRLIMRSSNSGISSVQEAPEVGRSWVAVHFHPTVQNLNRALEYLG